MTLQEANNFFESLKTESPSKSEIKTYTKFTDIINGLQQKDLSSNDISAIEAELSKLELLAAHKNKRRFYKKALIKFEKYLKESYSLVLKGYYQNQGIALGTCFGLLFGTIFFHNSERSLGVSLGLLIGMVIGLTIGKAMDAKASKEGNLL